MPALIPELSPSAYFYGLRFVDDTELPSPQAQEVASAGQQLVIARHSMAARSEQIERCLRAMVVGTHRGARWCQCEFVVDEVSPCVG